MNKFWNFQNAVEGNGSELILDGVIASESWWGDEVTPAEFRNELKQHTGNMTVIINSPGGDVFAGVSIYNALRDYEGNVTVRVDGLAASIASIVAMAGDKIIMSPGSMMMIHKPWTMAMGDSEELKKTIQVLDGIESSLIPIYATRTGKSEEEIVSLLEAETWLTAEEAVAEGFADEAIEAKSKAAAFSDAFKSLVNGNLAFNMNATKESMDNLVEKIKAEEVETTEPVKVDPVVEEPEVTEVKPDVTEEIETEEVIETTVEEIKPIEKEHTQMSTTNEVAATQVMEPAAQATVTPKAEVKDYLKSKASVQDFANVLASVAGGTAQDFKDAWTDHLETKMGITNPEILLPTPVIRSIEDAFAEGGEIWNKLNKTGLDVFSAAWDTVVGEDSRAKGYNRSVDETKNEEVITIANRVIRPQFIYKYITLPKEVVKEQRSTGALLTYILTELPRRIVREVERAVIIGDGRANGSANKISSFVSVKSDATAENVFAKTYEPAVGESTYETMLRASSLVKADGGKYLIAKAGYVTSVLLEQGVNGGFLFAPGTNVGTAFGFAGVITPDWFDDTSDADNDAYIVTLSQYKTVGDNSIESFTNFQLSINKNEYLQEIWAGGALTARNSAVAIAKAGS